jgi:hypothetical protein
MKSNKLFVSILSLLLILSFALVLPAQNSKPVPPENNYYSLSSSTSINDNTLTKTQPDWPKLTSEQQNVLDQLNQARANGDVVKADQLYRKYCALHGTAPVQVGPNPQAQCGPNINPKIGNPQPDYMWSSIANVGNWSVAVATVPTGAPNAGRIWVAVTKYANAASDTLQLYYSDNGGVSWALWNYWYFINYSMDYRNNESDLEICWDGTSVWVIGVAGFTDMTNNRVWSAFYRFNTTTFSFAEVTLQWPGNGTASNLYYNPRITSDNTEYTSATYVYLSCSFDSTYGASQHWVRQKFALITSPFAASLTVNYAQPSTLNNGGFYWNSNALVAGTYIWTDIAHYQPSGNRIMTVFNIDAPGNGHSMYMAWSDDYGSTVAGNLQVTEANESQWARISANGGATNQNLMITYRRQYSGTDWDPYYQNTTTGGITVASWTGGYINSSTQEAWYVDVIGVRNAVNQFKAAYVQDTVTGAVGGYYTGWGGTSWNSPLNTRINSFAMDNGFGRDRAGYKLGGGDDCMAIWCTESGSSVWASRLCQTTIGINNNNNEVPKEYNLAQNYPNPFNPMTLINYSIPNSGLVKLVVYDVIGKEVTTLVNEVKNIGNYSVTFDASNVPSGVYFYKIMSGSFVETKKMILIK